jgi:hypothetical protein
MPEAIVQFWSKLPITQRECYVHRDDIEWFAKHQPSALTQLPISFNEYIGGNRFGKNDKQPHLSLLPAPFIGNLQSAKIFILLMNPGLSTTDYYAEEVQEFRNAQISNLHQTNANDEFPFFLLNPEFAWSGGFIWWEALLRPILLKLVESKQVDTYYEALAFLAKKLAVIELIPYHSVDGKAFNGRGNPWRNLASAKEALKFVQRLCNSSTHPLILVLRSHKRWHLETHKKCSCFRCPAIRRPTLNPDIEEMAGNAGRAILEALAINLQRN